MKRWIYYLAWPVMLAPLVYMAFRWKQLPDQIPVHYGINGEADRIGPKTEALVAVLVLTAMSICLFVFLPMIYKIDPKKTAVENKGRLRGIALASSLLLSLVTFVIVDSAGSPALKFNGKWIIIGISALWCVMGNYMYNLKPNYFAGLRLPWTLNNEDNWRLTHRLAGKLWFAGGAVSLLFAIFLPMMAGAIAFIIIAFFTVIIPAVYSYRLYAKSKL